VTPLAETHAGTPPAPSTPDLPRSRVGLRLVALDDQPIRFPSDCLVRSECITKAEWERRHNLTYPPTETTAAPATTGRRS
jgi:hypothetical protein